MEAIKVNLIPNGISEACHASQYDEGRQIRLDLFDGLTPYTIQAGDTFTLNVRKPDNHVITETVTGTEGNTYLVIDTTEQMTAVTGENLCEIRLENNGDNIGSLNFIMQVEKDVIANGIPSESVIEDLEALVVEAVGDNYYTKSEVDALIENVEDNTRVVDEASGAIAKFNTDLTENLLSAVAEFSASQAEGTPTPSTPIPIVGVDKVNVVCCGKNLFDKSKMVISTGRFVKYGVDAYNDTLPNGEFNLKANQAYTFTFSGENSTNFESFGVYNEEGTRVAIVYNNKKATFTPASTGAYFLAFSVSSGNWGGTWDNYDIQLEIGSTATDFEPYNGTTVIINLGGTYFGGYIDVVTGKITLTHKKYVFDENLPQSSFGLTIVTGYTQLSYSPYIDEGKANTIFLSDKFGFETGNTHSVYKCWNTTSVPRMFLALPDTVATKADAISWLQNNPTEVIAELATPIVVYASNTAEIPTIVGDNQVFADSGDVAVKYKKSVKAYIDDKLKAIFVSYDNSNSGLTATNTQAAIDELAEANRSVNPLRTTAPVEELETRDEPETDEPETRGDDNEER